MENAHKTRNIAALLRTCDAVGVLRMHAVAQSDIRRHHMVSAGSRKWVPLKRHPTVRGACNALHDQGFRILAAHQSRRAIDFREADYTRPSAILLGGELFGVSAIAAAEADQHITVPMLGMVASLNVSVAGALVLYEAMRQREAAGLYDRSRLDAETHEKLLFEWAYPRVARRCRELGVAYPALDAEGSLIDNPFDKSGDVITRRSG